MNVFISWSGERSRLVAEAFYEYLPTVLMKPETEFYFSKDMYKGANWNPKLHEALCAADFGILCVTRDNCAAPWLIYEAGFLSYKLGVEKVAPFLLDVSPSELQGPIAQFQSTIFEEEDLRRLFLDIGRFQSPPVRERRVSRNFDRMYGNLKEDLDKALAMTAEDGAEDLARKTLAGVEQLLRLSAENQSLLQKIASGL